ncbi:unnamed protein product [Tilletia laevis]|uniref:Uncharacterized protein n=2 Tax=Tilletia TaxID=13289 RepID=A0A9N8QMK8_9BASI|nr:hypothetical protein CF335_g9379 [Tilletia laevis]CAD6903952.1 unnamed protein product [Tilletia caries]CAD6960909.1 unnamed protein product [Tilletia laevis]
MIVGRLLWAVALAMHAVFHPYMPFKPTSPVPSYLLMCTIILIRLGVSIAFSVVHYCAVYGSSCSSTSCSTPFKLNNFLSNLIPPNAYLTSGSPKRLLMGTGETQRRAGWRSGGPQVS